MSLRNSKMSKLVILQNPYTSIYETLRMTRTQVQGF